MAEVTFVGLATLAWMMVAVCIAMVLGTLIVIAHVINVEVRHYRRVRSARKARREVLERMARTRRRKEQQAQDERFYADIQEISNGF